MTIDNTVMMISGMVHDVMKTPEIGEMVNFAVDYIRENKDELIGKELFVRKLINQLIYLADNAKSPEVKKKIGKTIDDMFEVLGKTKQM